MLGVALLKHRRIPRIVTERVLLLIIIINAEKSIVGAFKKTGQPQCCRKKGRQIINIRAQIIKCPSLVLGH
jgi:hypothetical protein